MSRDTQERKNLRQACLNHLDQAERLKKSPSLSSKCETESPTASLSFHQNSHILKTPMSNRSLPTSEKIILLRGSKLHGCVFPEWTSPPKSEEFVLNEDKGKFV